MKKMLSIAALIGLTNLGLFAVPSAEAAQFTVGGNRPYGSGVCIDVSGGATAPSTRVQAWACHGWLNQQWTMQGPTIYGIGSTGSTQNCLSVRNAGTANGTAVTLNPCNGSAGQRWWFYNGYLYNPNSQKCLDAGNSSNGTALVVNNCAIGRASQQWQIK